ncbi:uncharacterized protein TEOVI_000589800 [Trypanosoma equiperdum]|uniref:Abnormal spindle-like microcephaly-associated protein ASH domain-containing protein n=1 Tax=Trypanosoma equiperdum TaxID=5694 RepID=A0A1G4I6T8_TRYEQ|nr:hypothetical protein, conserved [Trypanosoma equiperdum]
MATEEPVSDTKKSNGVTPRKQISHTVQTLTSNSSEGSIHVHPTQGYYANFDVDTVYVIPFTVRNLSREICALRFTHPNNQTVFRIKTDSVRLAPGLTHVIEAEFFTHTSQDYEDSFVVFTDKESITIPLVAKCFPDVEFPLTLDFGTVERNTRGIVQSLAIRNPGRRVVRVHIVPEGESAASALRVRTANCDVGPFSEGNVMVELLSPLVGRHKFPLTVTVDGEAKTRTVTVTVEVIDCRGTLLNANTGEELHSLMFPKTYVGAKRTMELIVRNDSRQSVSFAFQLLSDGNTEDIPPFSFVPQQGRLGPREKKHVTAIFAPMRSKEKATGWTCRRDQQTAVNETFEWLYSLLFVETEHTHTLRATGTSTTTVAWLSQTVVDFGECAMNDYRDFVLQVHNGHKDAPLYFKFPRIAHFHISPDEGNVSAAKSVPVRLTFHPRRLGNFSERFNVVFNNTETTPLTVVGVATKIVPQQKRIGGIDKLPQDFERTMKAIEPVAEPYVAAAPPETYANLDDVDLGMVPAEGLRPIEPELVAPIGRSRSAGEMGGLGAGDHLPLVTLDVKTLIRKVYKEAPSNAAERRDCKRELQPMELLRIVAPVKVLEFHRVTVGSTATKPFFLYNATSAAVLATMPTDEEHLSFSPQAQVIPPGRSAVFDVTFRSQVVQVLQQVMQITINGRHLLRFTMQADSVPVEVSLSREEMVLHFSNFSEEPVARSTVVLSNNGNSEAVYSWALQLNNAGTGSGKGSGSGPFAIEPMSGTIPPMSKVTAYVSFSPPYGIITASACARLQVERSDGVKTLNITGAVPVTSCAWGKCTTAGGTPVVSPQGKKDWNKHHSATEALIELQKVPAGRGTRASITLHNKGKNVAFFTFDGVPSWLTVSPESGRVGPRESEEISLLVYHEKPEALRTVMNCCVRGIKKPLKLTVSVDVCAALLEVITPHRQNTEAILDFGMVYIGTEKALPVRFKNTSDVDGVILVDLRQHMEFAVECAADVDSAAIHDATVTNNNSTDPPTMLQWCGPGEREPGMASIIIPPCSELGVLFVYRPVSTAEDGGRFFVSWRHVGTDIKNPLVPLVIIAQALQSRVAVTPRFLKFPCTVVDSPSVPATVTIKNTSSVSVHWRLQPIRNNEDSPTAEGRTPLSPASSRVSSFVMSISGGVLAPHASEQVSVTFVPDGVGNWRELYGIYVDGDLLRHCADLSMSGFAALPRLLCDVEELAFPPIPLNITVRRRIIITNDGFDHINLSYHTIDSGPLTITFPNGTSTGLMGRIPVEIEFCSQWPVSAVSSIKFSSNKGETLTLPFRGAAINSFLTNAPYVIQNANISKIASSRGDEEWKEPLIYREIDSWQLAADGGGHKVRKVGGETQYVRSNSVKPIPPRYLEPIAPEFYVRCEESLRLWLNYNVFLEPVANLVTALQLSDGRLLLDAARRMGVKKQSRAPDSSESTTSRTLVTLESLMSLLKLNGGCLSEVQIIYLMTYEAYCRHQKEVNAEAIPLANFTERSTHCWTVVVLQFIRVVYFAKLRIDSMLAQYPSLGKYMPVEELQAGSLSTAIYGSNVFSGMENILLYWATYNLRQCIKKGMLKDTRAPIRRFEDLRDCVAVAACIFVFVPSAAAYVSADRFVPETVTQSDLENNISLLTNALVYVGFPSSFSSVEQILQYGPLDWLLLLSTLFHYLPRFIPTGTIVLKGKLLSPATHTIEVKNTSNTVRVYTVEMSNCSFRAVPREFTVDPGGTFQLQLEVTLRFNRRLEGECVLVDSAQNLVKERMPLVFHLVALPSEEPLRTVHLQAPLYTVVHQEICVENPFAQNYVATLRLSQEYKNDGGYSEGEFGKLQQGAFYISAGVVSFNVGEPTKVSVQFAPCARGQYEAQVTFHDVQLGEFSIVLIGTCIPPKPIEKFVTRAEVGEACNNTVMLKLHNQQFERMMNTVEDCNRFPSSRVVKGPSMPELTNIPYSVTFVNESFVGPSPFFIGPESIFFTRGDQMLELQFSFCPKVVGDYNGYIILASKYDVRTILLHGKGIPVGEKSILRFSCPARQSIVQRVPIVNNTKESWLITATIEGDCFSGQKEVRIPRGKSREYLLRYNPAWVSSDTGTLTLHNRETGERRTFMLYGESVEPLCEDVITVECRAREKRIETLTIPDINNMDGNYTVETDLPFATGKPTVLVRRGTNAKYDLILHPLMGGTFNGTVVCRAPNGHFAWYGITIIVSAPEKEGTLNICTDTRTPVTAYVSIQNPMDKTIDFTVGRYGVGLFGENSILVEPSEPSVYSLLFLPSRTGKFPGRLTFFNKEVGEFWYELDIVVEDAAPEEVAFSSEIGVPQTVQVRIPNNTPNELPLCVTNTNHDNFSVVPSNPRVPPYSELTIDIVYKPTAIGRPQEAMIKLLNLDSAEWCYHCRGVGHAPAEFAPVECVCEALGRVSVVLKFKNPFSVPMMPDVEVKCEEMNYYSAAAQSLPGTPIAPATEASIVVMYEPKTVGRHNATVLVKPKFLSEEVQDMTWVFPLKGLAEWRSHDQPLRFRCVARKKVEETVELVAPGMTAANLSNVTITLDLERGQQYASAVRNSLFFKVHPTVEVEGMLKLDIRFVPLRPFVAMADLVVRAEKESVWRYSIVLEASRADVDDTLVVKSTLRAVSTITFDIYNIYPHSSPFTAYFTPDSSRDFSVGVPQGVLPPFIIGQRNANAATTMQVLFSPTARLPQPEGTLIIDTEEMQWIYKVIGKVSGRPIHP